MKPDILLLQETGDNNGQSTGSGVDSVSTLEHVIALFTHGGTDIYNGGVAVTSYLQKHDAAYDLPFVFVSSEDDNFNRNVILGRVPFGDLNGDQTTLLSDIPSLPPDAYAPGGDGGIRGFMFAKFDLPDADYAGDVVIGNAHLKAGGGQSDKLQRLRASQNVAYFIDYFYYGAGAGVPDPNGTIQGFPCDGTFCADTILDANTPVIIGGDWNEDESSNGRKGPALRLTEAQFADSAAVDGTDRDQPDMIFDSATNVLNGSGDTRGGSELDYLAWADSIATARRAWMFDSSDINSTTALPELLQVPSVARFLNDTIDHLPVIADFVLPEAGAACPGDLNSGGGVVDGADLGLLLQG